MAQVAFAVCLVISGLVVLWMSSRNYENIDIYYWTIVILIPIIILGYWLKTQVTTAEGAMIAFCFIYLDSTILFTVLVFLMLRTLGLVVKPWLKLFVYSMAFIHLFVVWNCAFNDMYFKSIRLINTKDGTVTKMTGGPLLFYHYVYIGIMLALIVSIIITGFIKNGTFSKRAFVGYASIAVIGLIIYGSEWLFDLDFSLLPFLYVMADVFIAVAYDRIHSHDISCIISEHQTDRSKDISKIENIRGYAAFDLDRRFLCSNSQMKVFWPDLSNQRVDEKISEDNPIRDIFYSMIDAYIIRNERTHKFRVGDSTIECELSQFKVNKYGRMMGYFIEARDITVEQGLMDQISDQKENLEVMVEEKTADILSMQGKIVTGMANMIENRDNNTGGHVKRTSDIISIVIDEIIKQDRMPIDRLFARDIVRAAPMHDLGKISIENSILNKPSKLTDEEYEQMKLHAAKSGEMVMILLDGVEEEHFVNVAFNVARHHHERWDGKGYPDNLVGTMIPIEARIMALADVYDALASKRSYKEAMDPKLVAKIMLEGMGTQFDPQLKPVFIGCRERLEQYYRVENNA